MGNKVAETGRMKGGRESALIWMELMLRTLVSARQTLSTVGPLKDDGWDGMDKLAKQPYKPHSKDGGMALKPV